MKQPIERDNTDFGDSIQAALLTHERVLREHDRRSRWLWLAADLVVIALVVIGVWLFFKE